MLSEERTKFDYLFNAVMYAAQEPNPAKHDYRGKTLAMFAYVRDLEAKVRLLSGAGEDAKDAARYRWLRKQSWDEGMLCVVAWPRQAVRLGHDCPSLQRLDAAIDAALSTIEGQEGSSAIRSGTIRKE
jgi:hypothetical protein